MAIIIKVPSFLPPAPSPDWVDILLPEELLPAASGLGVLLFVAAVMGEDADDSAAARDESSSGSSIDSTAAIVEIAKGRPKRGNPLSSRPMAKGEAGKVGDVIF